MKSSFQDKDSHTFVLYFNAAFISSSTAKLSSFCISCILRITSRNNLQIRFSRVSSVSNTRHLLRSGWSNRRPGSKVLRSPISAVMQPPVLIFDNWAGFQGNSFLIAMPFAFFNSAITFPNLFYRLTKSWMIGQTSTPKLIHVCPTFKW